MKRSSILYGLLTIILASTTGATLISEDFICGKRIILNHAVKKTVSDACDGIKSSTKPKIFPYVYNGSSTFFVSDAALFAWPIIFLNGPHSKVTSEKLRLIIDSSCNLFGIVMKSKNSPDKRCFRPVKRPSANDPSSSHVSRNQPRFRGYRCGNTIFGHLQLEITMKDTLGIYQLWQYEGRQIGYYGLEDIDKLFGESVLLLPSHGAKIPEEIMKMTSNPNLIVMSPQQQLIGMVNKIGNQWEKCLELWEKEPERPQAVDSTRNSIGEFLFSGVGNYRCGELVYSRESINSHMQVACTLIKPPQGSKTTAWKNFLVSMGIIPSIGNHEVWKMHLKLPENDNNSIEQKLANNGIIILDKECNFHGVYWHSDRALTPCDKLSPSESS
ncbi:putative candidate secreted effector protein [Blumeria hordei DH14]|uniref:Putative candidate secreted effector protein n=1 Tax=Blumeria graminis f. sp. hordei (strain DH14) TaxID=546991 RepID=N1JJY3_BLUG1|nr:putative candidate secreted effector protein [Blumeria hordei DH14]